MLENLAKMYTLPLIASKVIAIKMKGFNQKHPK